MRTNVGLMFVAGMALAHAGCGEFLCQTSCESAVELCEGDFETDAAAIRAQAPDLPCDDVRFFDVAGSCADGKQFLYRSNGLTSVARYYSADTGEFVGFTQQSDAIDLVCSGRHYWPNSVRCDNPTVTEAICGRSYAVGDVISLP